MAGKLRTADEYNEVLSLHCGGMSATAIARQTGIARSTIQGMIERTSVTATPPNPQLNAVPPTGGTFPLGGRPLLINKPQDVWKPRFYGLDKSTGYLVEHLAQHWGCSAELLRKKARAYGSFRYVENPELPGDYIACIVHPDTPKGV